MLKSPAPTKSFKQLRDILPDPPVKKEARFAVKIANKKAKLLPAKGQK